MLKQIILLWFSILSLVFTLSCRKKQPEIIEPPDPSCENGSCCDIGHNVEFLKHLNGELAFYDGRTSLRFKEAQYIHKLFDGPVGIKGFGVCPQTYNKLPRIPYDGRNAEEVTQYNYKVWGRAWKSKEVFDFSGLPRILIAVDRMEVVK
ncbi:hypothetical protein [Rudanella lutea]|uniref:hypothetical protein n=1 Tax=Rudanella lutea TaxID=451374 RepID=UPI0003622E9E|nr:hypothetical protein [Rudanella lutea]